jgi:hypothetical protein
VSGINAIIYFAPRNFEMTGLARAPRSSSRSESVVTNLVLTFAGLWLMIGWDGNSCDLGTSAISLRWAVRLAFYTGTSRLCPSHFAFIAAHAWVRAR